MLTKDDLNKVQLLIVAGSSQVIKEIDKLKDDIQEVNKKIELIPNKDEYFEAMDMLMGELKKETEEQELQSEKLSQHDDRLEKLEKKVGITPPY